MNLAPEKINEIKRLRIAGKSQNEIVAITGVSKPYVNEVCKSIVETHTSVNGFGNLEQEFTPAMQPVRFPNYPVSYPENNNSNVAELRYKDQRIADLEMQLKDIKSELNKVGIEHSTLTKEHAQLQIEHRSIEAKHQYEKDNIVQQNTFSQRSSLDGLMDKVVGPILNNEKLVDAISIGLIHKLSGGTPQQQPQIQGAYDHPLINNAQTGDMIREILEVLKQFNAAEIESLHTLFGVFMLQRPMIATVTKSAIDYVSKIENQKNQQ